MDTSTGCCLHTHDSKQFEVTDDIGVPRLATSLVARSISELPVSDRKLVNTLGICNA